MEETGMQNTHITNRLKQFSKEVFEFTKRYDSRNVNESNDTLQKDFSACRLLVISKKGKVLGSGVCNGVEVIEEFM